MHAILIVEDDPDIREDLAELLRDEGYTVSTAGNGAEALTVLREGFSPCVVLLDLMMPTMNGWDFRSAMLREKKLASIPVVVLSGVADADDQAAQMKLDYLAKPIDVDRLLHTLESYCGGSV